MTDTPRPVPLFDLYGSRAGNLRAFSLVLLVGAVCAALALLADRELALAIREALPKDTRKVFGRITEFGKADYYLYVLIPLWLFARMAFLRTAPMAVANAWWALSRMCGFLLSSLALSALVVHFFKLTVGRARPKELFLQDIYGAFPFSFDTDLSSFPSGHSQTVWSLMTGLMILFPRAWPLFAGWATLITTSRVLIGAHYPSDVLMGAFIGAMTTLYVRHRWYPNIMRPNFKFYLVQGDVRP